LYGTLDSKAQIVIDDNQFVLNAINNENKIFLETFDVGESCAMEKIMINIFDKNTMQWESQLENYEKFKTFFGCPVCVETETTKIEDYEILEFEVAYMVAKRLNFTVIEIDGDFTYLKDTNISFFDDDRAFFASIYLRSYWFIENTQYSYTTSYDTDKIFFAVTPGESYTNYEKFYLPFDDDTWKYLIITFAVAFIFIFIINQLNLEVQVIFG
jgi:hypothetical protein